MALTYTVVLALRRSQCQLLRRVGKAGHTGHARLAGPGYKDEIRVRRTLAPDAARRLRPEGLKLEEVVDL